MRADRFLCIYESHVTRSVHAPDVMIGQISDEGGLSRREEEEAASSSSDAGRAAHAVNVLSS